MQLPQTTYPLVPPVAALGMVDQCSYEDKISRTASENIPVGAFVMANAAPPSVGIGNGTIKKIPDGTTAVTGAVLGVASLDTSRSPYSVPTTAYDSGGADYLAQQDVAVLHKGRVWMWSETAATEGNPVFVRCTAASGKPTGVVRDGTTALFYVHPTATFAGTTTAAGLVLVEVK